MDKFRILKRIENKDDKTLISNVLDKLEAHNKKSINTHTNFLDNRVLKLVEDTLKFLKVDYTVYVKHSECEKSIIYFGKYENFVTAFKISGNFSHQEILGTLFSLGIEVDQIGDIFINDGYAIITVLTKLKELFLKNLYQIGNKRVKVEEINVFDITRNFLEINIIIPSYRLDSIVGKLANLGRKDAQNLVKNGQVMVNYQYVNNNKIINNNDVISIRKVGKFIILDEVCKTKKDNLLIRVKKYI